MAIRYAEAVWLSSLCLFNASSCSPELIIAFGSITDVNPNRCEEQMKSLKGALALQGGKEIGCLNANLKKYLIQIY